MEGPAAELAALIKALCEDPSIEHEQWSLSNTSGVGRRQMALRLHAQGNLGRRLGIAALTLPVSEAIERRARSAGIKSAACIFHAQAPVSRAEVSDKLSPQGGDCLPSPQL